MRGEIRSHQFLASENSARKVLSWCEGGMSPKSCAFEDLVPRWWHCFGRVWTLWSVALTDFEVGPCGLTTLGLAQTFSPSGPSLLPCRLGHAQLQPTAQVSHPTSLSGQGDCPPLQAMSQKFFLSCWRFLRYLVTSMNKILTQGHIGIRLKRPDCVGITVLNFQVKKDH